MSSVLGIHHVTAIAGEPQRNVDFYAGLLGLRLVKRTVNFDDPGTYHLYYGDDTGRPGSLMTFFPWPGARQGRQGTGQASVTSFSIPRSSVGYWVERLVRSSQRFEGPARRLHEQVLSLRDPDGLLLELVADDQGDSRTPWSNGPLPAEHAILGFHSVTLWTDGDVATERTLVEALGFAPAASEEGRKRFALRDGHPGQIVDVRDVTGFWKGVVAVGTVHHVAFRAQDDEHQDALSAQVQGAGLSITERINRTYFHSMYFNEPGGVLFEIATDQPGFLIDEPLDHLGESLLLPPWLESRRASIEGALPPIRLPSAAATAT